MGGRVPPSVIELVVRVGKYCAAILFARNVQSFIEFNIEIVAKWGMFANFLFGWSNITKP